MRRVRELWNWWIGQLSDALPTLSTVRKRAAIVGFLDEGVLQLNLRDAPETRLGSLFAEMAEQDRKALSRRIEAATGGNRQVVMFVPREARHDRVVELPLAAEAHLTSVAENELDRWTPWRVDQAVFSIKVLERLPVAGKLTAEVSTLPRSALAPAMQMLDQVDLSLIGVLFERAEQPPQFIKLELEEAQPQKRSRYARIAWAAAAVALVWITAALFAQRIWAIREVESHLAPLAQSAEDTQRLAAELRNLSRLAGYAVSVKRDRPSAVLTLNALSEILPDDCWLDSLALEGDKLTIQGHATDALSLLPTLSASNRFRDVAFASEVVRDTEGGVEQFSITADVVPYFGP